MNTAMTAMTRVILVRKRTRVGEVKNQLKKPLTLAFVSLSEKFAGISALYVTKDQQQNFCCFTQSNAAVSDI